MEGTYVLGEITSWKLSSCQKKLHFSILTNALITLQGHSVFGSSGSGAKKKAPSHEIAHQVCLIASLMFTGAMGYRAGSNPYTGPGGAMLAALGGTSALYHLDKMVEWRRWEESRVAAAERLLKQHQQLGIGIGGGGEVEGRVNGGGGGVTKE